MAATATFDRTSLKQGATGLLENRKSEKQAIQNLNDRFASYIEKVRFLDAQNKKLQVDIDRLNGKIGLDSKRIKDLYEEELDRLKDRGSEIAKSKKTAQDKLEPVRKQTNEGRKKAEDAEKNRDAEKVKLDDTNKKLSDTEAEAFYLRRKLEDLDDDVKRAKKINNKLHRDLHNANTSMDTEATDSANFKAEADRLQDELDYFKQSHNREMQDLLSSFVVDDTNKNRQIFSHSFSQALREIRTDFDNDMAQNKEEMERMYSKKVREMKTTSSKGPGPEKKEEVTRVKIQISDLRTKTAEIESKNAMLEHQLKALSDEQKEDEHDFQAQIVRKDNDMRLLTEQQKQLLDELYKLIDTKQTLDQEIAIYRKMLEGDEKKTGLRHLVEQAMQHQDESITNQTESKTMRSEVSTKTTVQRSAKGNIAIAECDPLGNFITLENTHKSKAEALSDWKLKRKIDGKREIIFSLPPKFELAAGKKVKIWAKTPNAVNAPPDQLVFEGETTWGVGNDVQTFLSNNENEERATHIQRTI